MKKFNDGFTGITFEYFLKQYKKMTEDEFYNLPEEKQEKIIAEYEQVSWR